LVAGLLVNGVLLVSGVPVEVVVEGLAAVKGLAVVEDVGFDMDEVEDKDVNTGVGRDKSTLIGVNAF
jgi:hypothetical protein